MSTEHDALLTGYRGYDQPERKTAQDWTLPPAGGQQVNASDARQSRPGVRAPSAPLPDGRDHVQMTIQRNRFNSAQPRVRGSRTGMFQRYGPDSFASGLIRDPLFGRPKRATSKMADVLSSGDLALARGFEGDDEEVVGGLSKIQASVNLVKCAIGAGSFNLPFAFRQGGLLFSFVGTLFFGWISAYTVNMLALSERRAWRRFKLESMGKAVVQTPSPKRNEQSKFTYPALGRVVFPNAVIPGTSINIMEVIIYIGIALTGLGVCAAYVDFITSTLPQVFTALDVTTTTLIIAPIFWLLSLLRTYRFLAFTSILGDIAVTAGIISVVVYGATQHTFKFDLPQFEVNSFPKFIGSTSFLFAIHIVILPIMQSMKERDNFKQVTFGSYTFITVINGLFGALCFMLFGENTKGNVVSNLPKSTFLDIVKILLCVDLLFSLPMILAAAREVVEEPLVAGRTKHVNLIRNTLRTVLVGLVFAICFGVPDFADMVSLVGGLVNSLMGFILPPMIHMKQQYDLDWEAAERKKSGALVHGHTKKLTTMSMIKNGAIMLFGASALVVSTYYTVKGIVDQH